MCSSVDLAAAAGADHGDELALGDAEAQRVERDDGAAVLAVVALAQAAHDADRFRHRGGPAIEHGDVPACHAPRVRSMRRAITMRWISDEPSPTR